MKKLYLLASLLFSLQFSFAQGGNDDYIGGVTFPANFVPGDYIEFLRVSPTDAGASGYYEISISYTRGNIAAAATHIASISHSNPGIWREAGRINNNAYGASTAYNFTVDCNTASANPRFRIRAVNAYGVATPIVVNIKVRSINQNGAWTQLNNSGNDLTVTNFLPMTTEWNLYVGNPFLTAGAALAIKAQTDGNVGIGTATPQSKLSVAGTITAQKVKVTATGWPDYVFDENYTLLALTDVEKYIRINKHLPEIPSAKTIETEGHDLGDINQKLLQKVEELTLYLIEEHKEKEAMKSKLELMEKQLQQLLKDKK